MLSITKLVPAEQVEGTWDALWFPAPPHAEAYRHMFPGGPLPLRIFEARYIDLVRRCLREDSGFGVVLIWNDEENAWAKGRTRGGKIMLLREVLELLKAHDVKCVSFGVVTMTPSISGSASSSS